MRDQQASRTAAWVAVCRGLAPLLPEEARLAEDRFGVRFGPPRTAALLRLPRPLARALTLPLQRSILYLQLRTRALDDALVDFVRAGGAQVLLLGAGFDCRAARFAGPLGDATVFEVDHPATQKKKRAVLDALRPASAPVRYLSWDFERQPLSSLPAALAALGHDATRPTLTLWEGVTMYLTSEAIDGTVAMLRTLSASGSQLAFTYFDRAARRYPWRARVGAALVARLGEPFRFGWDPRQLPAWLDQRGWSLVDDHGADALARRWLPARYWSRFDDVRHVALARRS